MKEYLMAVLMVFVFSSSPLLAETSLTQPTASTIRAQSGTAEPMPSVQPVASDGTNALPPIEAKKETVLRLLDRETGTVSEIGLEEYLVGVVFAEMPASFHAEALKAQAVAARSYLLRRIESGYGSEKHSHKADVCTDSAHCTAYRSYEEAVTVWNEATVDDAFDTVRQAVEATRGEVLTYEGETADCLFHASSHRVTESAESVWGSDVPYLVSVISPEEACEQEITVSAAAFRQALRSQKDAPVLSSSPSEWIEETILTDSKRVESVSIGGTAFRGTHLRSLFSLPSTAFTLSFSEDSFVFLCRGYGHGVGLSQYGADRLGQKGYTYTQILSHYYPGTVLESK